MPDNDNKAFGSAFKLPIKYDYHGTHFFDADGRMIAQIRGWGYLTGTGGLNLPDEEAVKIQDAVAGYIETAVNSHETLKRKVAELERVIKDAAEDLRRVTVPDCNGCEGVRDALLAALKEVRDAR